MFIIQRRNQEAIEFYDKVLAIKPNGIEALNNKAFALANLDKNEGALVIIEKASGLDSMMYTLLSTKAFILYNLKRYDEAKAYYNRVLKPNPNFSEILSGKELMALMNPK